MSGNNERGATEGRSSALWGTGSRGGDRSSVLWGKGGRGILVSCVAAFALAAPLAASAGNGKGSAPAPVAVVAPASAPAPPSGGKSNSPDGKTWVAQDLLDKGKSSPNAKIDVIISSSGGTDGADKAFKWLAKFADRSGDLSAEKNLNLIGGIAASIPAKLLEKLQSVPGLNVTPNALVKVSALKSTQMWPYESGNSQMWAGDTSIYAGKSPAIAIVDSGVEQRSDFGTRVIASVNLSTIAGNTSLDDQRGHGTFVAGIAAGAAPDLTGAAPAAPIVSVKVMNDQGQAKTSDVITACQWILDNKAQYNIRVANFSLHSTWSTNFYRDPLDQAVEKLWFNGVTVVAAAGNYGTAAGPSGVLYSPGNDPFVITVGAVDLGGTFKANDDTVAPWSAYGYTRDGFYKPDISAPGRYMVGPIPAGSTIAALKATNLVGTDRIQLSGTSFAAPIVAGTAAQILTRHPNWTPDQVKGALMRTARALHIANPRSAGLGELTASRAAAANYAPNPNIGLEQFLKPDVSGTGQLFDAMSWSDQVKAHVAWNAMSWASQSWSDMSWADQSWLTMSWADMSWAEMSWADMSWAEMSWADMASEDAAEGDAIAGDAGYAVADPLAAADQAAASADTGVAVDPVPDPVPAPDALVPPTAPTVTAPDATVPAPVLP